MNQKYSAIFFLFFILFVCSSCYTVTYPETCPGVSELQIKLESDEELACTY